MRIKASMVKNGTGISFFEILALARDLVLAGSLWALEMIVLILGRFVM